MYMSCLTGHCHEFHFSHSSTTSSMMAWVSVRLAESLTVCVTVWLDDWVTDSLAVSLIDWMTELLIDESLTDGATNLQTVSLFGWMAESLTDWLSHWLIDWVTGWLRESSDWSLTDWVCDLTESPVYLYVPASVMTDGLLQWPIGTLIYWPDLAFCFLWHILTILALQLPPFHFLLPLLLSDNIWHLYELIASMERKIKLPWLSDCI